MTEENTKKKFDKLLTNIPDELWWKWVSSWLDEESIVDMYSNWEEDCMKEEINKIEELIKEHNSKAVLTHIHKEDFLEKFEGKDLDEKDKKEIEFINNLDHEDLENIASNVMDCLCDNGDYWFQINYQLEKLL